MTVRVRFHYDDLPFVKACGPLTVRRMQREAASRAGLTVVDDPSEPVDVLHANTISPWAPRQFARARAAGSVVVAHGHTTAEDMAGSFTLSSVWSRGARPHLRRIFEAADWVIVPSAYTRGLIVGYGVTKPIEVISNGVDVQAFDFSEADRAIRRDRLRRVVGVDGARFVAAGVGLVLERKGIRDYMAAAEQSPELLYLWGGEIPSPLISLSPRLRLALQRAPENCRMLGYVDDVRDVYAAADAFAFPSFEENQGIVTLEAAASGLPLVVRDIPVYRGWLKHGENALMFSDARGLATHLRALERSPELRSTLANAAKQMAWEHRLERVGADLARTYDRALSLRKAA